MLDIEKGNLLFYSYFQEVKDHCMYILTNKYGKIENVDYNMQERLGFIGKNIKKKNIPIQALCPKLSYFYGDFFRSIKTNIQKKKASLDNLSFATKLDKRNTFADKNGSPNNETHKDNSELDHNNLMGPLGANFFDYGVSPLYENSDGDYEEIWNIKSFEYLCKLFEK